MKKIDQAHAINIILNEIGKLSKSDEFRELQKLKYVKTSKATEKGKALVLEFIQYITDQLWK